MNQKRIMFLVCMVVLLGMLLIGCRSSDKVLNNQGSLKIVLSPEGLNNLTPKSVSDHIAISKYVVTMSKGATVTSQEVAYTSNTQEITFTNLAVGEWNIDVVAKDADNYSCYGGSVTGTVATTLNTVNVPLYLLNGNLDCTVKLPQITGINISSGVVKLVNPMTGTSVDLSLLINGATGLVDFGSVKAGTWYMEAEVFDNASPVAWGSGVLTVYPDRPNHALIEFTGLFESGDLQIIVTINESPADPTGLSAASQNGSVVLNWNANLETNIVGYAVYRATTETGFKRILSYSLVVDTTFTDSTVEPGNTYYYWVQAYNTEGYSSELSSASSVTIIEDQQSTGTREVLLAYDSTSGELPEQCGWTFQVLTGTPSVRVENGELIFHSVAADAAYYITHPYVATDTVYIKTYAKTLPEATENSLENIPCWMLNPEGEGFIKMESNGVSIRSLSITSQFVGGYDTSVYHLYELRKTNSYVEVYIDNALVWSGPVSGGYAGQRIGFGDIYGGQTTAMAVKSVEVGRVISQ